MTTNVPTVTFSDKGFVAPTELAILAGTQLDLNAAFDNKLNFTTMDGSVTNSTPQGQWAASLTAIIGDVDASFLFLTQMFDPAYAYGRYQDALARIYFIERNPALPTTVSCLCTGGEGVVIPIGAEVKDDNGVAYFCTQGGTIDVSGNITLSFECGVVGPTTCLAGTISRIYQAIPGWDTVLNLVDGVPGVNVETKAAFELRRSLSTAQNSMGSLPSVRGAVLTLPNVLDAYVVENNFNTSQTIGGVLLGPNSIYVAVEGGDSDAIAQAIWSKKAPGCSYNGNTTVIVEDQSQGYNPPYPSYTVKFQRPVNLPIFVNVLLANSELVPSDAVVQIQNAIVAAFAGLDNGPRARIGTKVYASRYYSTVALLGPWAQIISINVGTTGPGSDDSVSVNVDKFPTINPANITVTLS